MRKKLDGKEFITVILDILLALAALWAACSALIFLRYLYSWFTSETEPFISGLIQGGGHTVLVGIPVLLYYLKFLDAKQSYKLLFTGLCMAGFLLATFAIDPIAVHYRNIQIEEYLNPANCAETVFWADDSPVYHYDSSCNQFGKEDHFNGSIEEAESDGAIYPCPDCFKVWVEQRQNELEPSQ